MATTRTDRDRQRPPTRPVQQILRCLTAGLLGLSLATPTLGGEELDSIVAVVNDDVVVQSELTREINLAIPQLKQQGTPIPPPEQLRKQVLERLILKRLQQQRAKQLGITVDEAALTNAVQTHRQS